MGITNALQISPAELTTLEKLLHRYLPGVEILAFGSRVKGTARASSDLDLVAMAGDDLQAQIAALREALEDSDLPFRVDLHVWHEIPEQFHHEILKNQMIIQTSDHPDRRLCQARPR